MTKKNLIFCGISHLSLNYGATAARFKNDVVFFDFKSKINDYFNNKITIEEPNLKKYLDKYKKKISFSSKLPHNLKSCIIFISVDINTSKNNISSYKYINRIIKHLINNVSDKNVPLVIMSQVNPGFTESIKWPKKYLFYQVETLIFGKAIERATNPERIIVGTYDGNKVLNKLYLEYLDNFKTVKLFMRYQEAELTKMFINSFLVSDLILTNLLSSFCKKLNLDWENPKKALKLDKRIGEEAYLDPGLGISGGNLERDIENLNKINQKLKIHSQLFNVFKIESIKQKNWIKNIISKYKKNNIINRETKIGIIGISYKMGTNSIKNSPSLIAIENLKKYNIFCYDELLFNKDIKKFSLTWKKSEEIINFCDILFIFHSSKNLLKKLLISKKIKIVVDPYKIINKKNNKFKFVIESL